MTTTLLPLIKCMKTDFVLNFAHLKLSVAVIKNSQNTQLLELDNNIVRTHTSIIFTCEFYKLQ